MNLLLVAKTLTEMCRSIESESYFELNRKQKVTYPYVVFNFDWETLSLGGSGCYIDIDLFDKGASYVKLLELETKFIQLFENNMELTDRFLIRFGRLTGSKIPTNDEMILRRNIRMYCKIDWRNRNE